MEEFNDYLIEILVVLAGILGIMVILIAIGAIVWTLIEAIL